MVITNGWVACSVTILLIKKPIGKANSICRAYTKKLLSDRMAGIFICGWWLTRLSAK